MKILIALVVLLVLLIQPVLFADEAPFAKMITDSSEMDRISREVVEAADSNRSTLSVFIISEEEYVPWRKRHPIGFGSLVGLGIGFGTGTFLAGVGGDTNVACAGSLFGTIGAGIGALIGSFFTAD